MVALSFSGSSFRHLLLTSASDTGLLSQVVVQPTCFSDHDLVTCRLHVPCDPLAAGFSQFFVDKLARIRQSIAASLQQSGRSVFTARQHTGLTLSLLAPTSAPEVLKLLTSRPVKSSPVDVLPSVLLRSCAAVFAPIITHMANLSFVGCRFPAVFKTAQVLPLLKKPGLDKEQMSSYRPISNLVTISKVIERLVLDRLRPHLLSSQFN